MKILDRLAKVPAESVVRAMACFACVAWTSWIGSPLDGAVYDMTGSIMLGSLWEAAKLAIATAMLFGATAKFP